MRAIFVLFDTLNRHYLEPYGGTVMETPNFRRLADRSVRFDNHYVGSLPCMPARRDLQTGRLNFLHRSWGPLEPFDVAMTEVMKKAGIYSHMITDHYHYLEVGGAGYLNAFSSFEMMRGQEGDRWKAELNPPLDDWRAAYHPAQFSDKPGDMRYHNMVNRAERKGERDFSSVQCFDNGCEFLDRNHTADNWFLQIETFDPHEPFDAPTRLKEKFASGWDGPVRDWPPYARVTEEEAEADEMRANYKALLAHCDEQLGRLLDKMDALGMWEDTMLIVSTDHGYLTGEHGWWAKNRMPAYQEIAHIPLFIHHPAHADRDGTAHAGLFQTPDLMPTLLEAFGCEVPGAVRGRSLLPALADRDDPGHAAVIFGYFGGAVNVTDGRHMFFRYPAEYAGTGALSIYADAQPHVGPFRQGGTVSREPDRGFGFRHGLPRSESSGHAVLGLVPVTWSSGDGAQRLAAFRCRDGPRATGQDGRPGGRGAHDGPALFRIAAAERAIRSLWPAWPELPRGGVTWRA